MPADEEPLDGNALVSDVLSELLSARHVRQTSKRRKRIRISPDGMLWLAVNRPGITFDELDKPGGTKIRITAVLAAATESLEAKQATIEGRLIDLDRDVFRRVIPFFALFAWASG